MSCTRPLTAYWSVKFGNTGKRLVTFKKTEAFSGVPLRLPCGKCPDCRLLYSAQWAVRGVHELRCHNANEFVTLTYDDKNLPMVEGLPTLRMRDQQLFMKRLRDVYGPGVRFMCAGEYGGRTDRPHMHFIMFNWTVEDKRFYKETERGDRLYKSEILRRLWPMGDNVIGDVSFESIAYVARYIVGKDEKPDWWYAGREVEFFNKSNRPGIGLSAFEKFSNEWYANDSVIIDGRELRPPRYYDVKLQLRDPELYDTVKVNRRRKAMFARMDDLRANPVGRDKTRLDQAYRRRRVREVILRRKSQLSGRKD